MAQVLIDIRSLKDFLFSCAKKNKIPEVLLDCHIFEGLDHVDQRDVLLA